jgi:hypothetical protein
VNALEHELRSLAAQERWPETPDLAGDVRARLAPRRRGRPPILRSRPAVAATALLALLAGVAAVPPARSAALELLGLTRGAKILRVERPPAVTRGPLDLGRDTTLAKARARLAFRPRLPPALGAPERVRYSDRIAGGALTVDWDGYALTQFQGGTTPFVKKLLDERSRVREVRVGDAYGFFISGPSHYVVLDRGGDAVDARAALADADVLLWDSPDGLSFRLETRHGPDEALAVARSLR